MGTVFISYAHQDRALARRLSKAITSTRVSVFMDEKSIAGGARIDSRIEQAIRDCAVLVVIVSPASQRSSWVPMEVGFALAVGRRVLPYLEHEAVDLPGFLALHRAYHRIQDLKKFVRSDQRIREDVARPKAAYGATAVTPTLENHLSATPWVGRGYPTDAEGPLSFDIELSLMCRGNELLGDGHIAWYSDGRPVRIRMRFAEGRIVQRKLLWFDYMTIDGPPAFGTIVFDLKDCARGEMRGRYLGFGATTRRLVIGNVEIWKRGNRDPRRKRP